MVVEVVDVVVVDDVVVDVDGAVVTGIVVVVVSAGAEVEVSTAIDDDVEPVSVDDDEFLSLPHPAIATAKTMKGTRRVDFTVEVWHAMFRLPDQGVSLVPTFNKL